MYYRVTTYGTDPARRDEGFAFADTKREQLKAIAGMQWIHVCDTDDVGGLMIIACYESTESAEAASEQVTAILGEMAQFMISAPQVKAGPVSWEL